ncbi:uncharacterized mitochondrial protein AtMg00810-like [Lathyrus oleraceus]|uniref:uncharacterized mitochondrial protein AtMg00810-like n=1 Tax=Pisum sativum TaxID=3888 RepID=UPI0021D247C0|nr:uncharacterized mitochondrial protein AtMg00810-like [Pisum sativum]
MHLDVKYAFLNGPLQEEVYVSQPPGFVKKNQEGMMYRKYDIFLGMKILDSEKGIILHHLKYDVELLKKFDLLNCKVVVTPTETNHKLDSDPKGDDVDATTFKQLVGSPRYLCKIRLDICYVVGMDLIKISKPMKLLIDNKSEISFAKNPVFHGRRKHIETKYHFLRSQVHNGVLEAIHYSTQKQLVDVLMKAIKTDQFIHLRDETGVFSFD